MASGLSNSKDKFMVNQRTGLESSQVGTCKKEGRAPTWQEQVLGYGTAFNTYAGLFIDF